MMPFSRYCTMVPTQNSAVTATFFSFQQSKSVFRVREMVAARVYVTLNQKYSGYIKHNGNGLSVFLTE